LIGPVTAGVAVRVWPVADVLAGILAAARKVDQGKALAAAVDKVGTGIRRHNMAYLASVLLGVVCYSAAHPNCILDLFWWLR
jgi:hypothetical protein